MLDVTFCNELFAGEGMDLAAQARAARSIGAMGLEIAPATLGPAPHELGEAEVAALRRSVEAEGLQVTGLHWLLTGYPHLSVTDPERRDATQKVLFGLVRLCAGLGGTVLIHGSPGQRAPQPGQSPKQAVEAMAALFGPVAEAAAEAGMTYCIEPLAPEETPVINTVAEAAALVRHIGNPAFATMIDTCAAGLTEPPVAGLIADWVPGGLIRHIHLNDTNRGAPGTGSDPFGAVVAALIAADWSKPVSIEPFRLDGDAANTFATGLATVRAAEAVVA